MSIERLKFRGLCISGKAWYYGLVAIPQVSAGHVKPGVYISNSKGMPFAYQVRPETIGQWTGLVDCKGVEIYEGDRLKSIEHPQDEPFVVESITPIDRLYGSYDTPRGDDWMSNAEYYEVIGNVHEVTT